PCEADSPHCWQFAGAPKDAAPQARLAAASCNGPGRPAVGISPERRHDLDESLTAAAARRLEPRRRRDTFSSNGRRAMPPESAAVRRAAGRRGTAPAAFLLLRFHRRGRVITAP